ncbi:MAG: glycine--tRNA ligase subunit beta [Anaplasma sp.]
MPCDVVFEILCEQLPVKTIGTAMEYVLPQISKKCDARGIKLDSARALATPHRIAFIAHDVVRDASHGKKEIKGPKVPASERALQGFLKKVGKSSVEELEIRSVGGSSFYYGPTAPQKDDLANEVAEVLQEMVNEFPLHKRMKWGAGMGHWVRPVVNVLCVIGGAVQKVSVAGIAANNKTYGSVRFMKDAHVVSGVKNYLTFMSQNMILLDQEERRSSIAEQLDRAISKSGLRYDLDDRVFEDLSGMLEHPRVLIGSVDAAPKGVPEAVVSCVLIKHQRYLALRNSSGNIVKFASVANVVNDRSIKTHEMVLSARLSDAEFLIKKDLAHELDHFVGLLSHIVFKSGLGTLLDKARRISALAKFCAVWIPHASMLHAERASWLAKADLATMVVKEFPELQGIMGRHYASHSGEVEDICVAIEEHYLPISSKGVCPSSPTGIAVAIADRVDSLVGLMATEKTSGSRDPFALRRMSIGLLRVIMENNISIPLDLIVSKAVALYVCDVKGGDYRAFSKTNKESIVSTVLSFCYDRLQVLLVEHGIEKEMAGAVVGSLHYVVAAKKKAEIISNYLQTKKGQKVLTAYRRVHNIVSKEDLVDMSDKCDKKLCLTSCELELYNNVKYYKKLLGTLVKENRFSEAMEALYGFGTAVDGFMDGVRICDKENLALYKNRAGLSVSSLNVYHLVLDFNKILKSA